MVRTAAETGSRRGRFLPPPSFRRGFAAGKISPRASPKVDSSIGRPLAGHQPHIYFGDRVERSRLIAKKGSYHDVRQALQEAIEEVDHCIANNVQLF
jgi:hypothetical protein